MKQLKYLFLLGILALFAACSSSPETDQSDPNTIIAPEAELDDYTDAGEGAELEVSDATLEEQATMTRAAIVARGKVWVDAHVPYNMNGSYGGWRTDCSGFISMAWNLRDSKGRKISANTSSLWNYAVRFTNVDDLQPGDAINSSLPGGATGAANHVVLFVKWLNKTKHTFLVYQERGRAYGTVQSTKQLIRSGSSWKMAGDNTHPHWYFMRLKNVK